MEKLISGNFFGITDLKLENGGLILTNTAYTHDFVDWHYHENAYFTFILTGEVIEGNKKGKSHLSAGSLLFHHAQDSHYNIKPAGKTRGMHLELETGWMNTMFDGNMPEGSFEVSAPKAKLIFYKILGESQLADDLTLLGIDHLALEVLGLLNADRSNSRFTPPWVKDVEDYLRDNYRNRPDLSSIAAIANVHPVYLSRSFSRYFGCTMAEYIRQLRVEFALVALSTTKNSLSQIAYQSGFADQSHMIRCFRSMSGYTPAYFRKLINSR